MIFCSKPFKHAFKTTRILSEIHIAPNFRSKAYGLNKSIFSVKLWVRQAFGTANFRQAYDFYHPQRSQLLP